MSLDEDWEEDVPDDEEDEDEEWWKRNNLIFLNLFYIYSLLFN